MQQRDQRQGDLGNPYVAFGVVGILLFGVLIMAYGVMRLIIMIIAALGAPFDRRLFPFTRLDSNAAIFKKRAEIASGIAVPFVIGTTIMFYAGTAPLGGDAHGVRLFGWAFNPLAFLGLLPALVLIGVAAYYQMGANACNRTQTPPSASRINVSEALQNGARVGKI